MAEYSKQLFSAGDVLTAADMTSIDNFLDALGTYKTGSFTPNVSDGTNSDATFVDRAGHYIQIGSFVFIFGRLILSNIGSLSGAIKIIDLPVTSEGGSPFSVGNGGINIVFAQGLSITAGESVTGYVPINTTEIVLRVWDASGGTTNMQASELSNSGDMMFSGFYIADGFFPTTE